MKTIVSPGPAARARASHRGGRLPLLGAVLLASLLPASAAQILQIHQSPEQLVQQASGNNFATFPRALAFDVDGGGGLNTRKILTGWVTTKDSAAVLPVYQWKYSTDLGASHASPPAGSITYPPTDFSNAFKRRDGVLVSVPWRPVYPPTPGPGFTFTYFISSDRGATWATHTGGTLHYGANTVLGMRFHRGIIEENDGSLYGAAYARFSTDANWRSVLLRSTDGGATWTYVSTIAASSTREYNETALVRCRDGSWLAVMRTDGPDHILRYIRSTNKGASWNGPAAALPGLNNAEGVDPQLALMPNGILVLSWGPPNAAANGGRDVHVAFSADGSGAAWSHRTTIFTGAAQVEESTGYTAIAPVGNHAFRLYGDTGTHWSYATENPSPNPYTVWQKRLEIVRAERNRIDLAGRYAAGALTLTTDLTHTAPAQPEMRPTGAFDGSTDYRSGAFSTAASGSYTLDLQQDHTLAALGICLHYNTPQSASIHYRADGSATWVLAKSYTAATHNAVDYTSFGTPITARYVRVQVSAAAGPVCLNEIELYTTLDTFEGYALNAPPYGYTVPAGGFWVSEGVTPLPTGYQSRRALALNDSSASANATALRTTSATTTKTLDFRLRPKAYAPSGSVQWRLVSGAANAFRLAVFPDGSIKHWNGSAWLATTGSGAPAGAGTAPLDAWSRIRVVASAATGTGTLYVNGVLKGTFGKETTVASLDGFLFAGSGTAAIGDQALFDDVAF